MNKNQHKNSLEKNILSMMCLVASFLTVNAQNKTPDKIAERFFMPAFQMGYINHNPNNISSGLIIQT